MAEIISGGRRLTGAMVFISIWPGTSTPTLRTFDILLGDMSKTGLIIKHVAMKDSYDIPWCTFRGVQDIWDTSTVRDLAEKIDESVAVHL